MGRRGRTNCRAVRRQQRTMCWSCLRQPEMLFIYSPRKENERWDRPISDSLCKSYEGTTLSARSQFVEKVKFFHLTNLNSVLRWIPATRKSTISFLPLLYQHWLFSWRHSHWDSFYSRAWTICLLLKKGVYRHKFITVTCLVGTRYCQFCTCESHQ